jgi:hypothetical protein
LDAAEKKELLRKIRCDLTRGASKAAIARKYDVTIGFVDYHADGHKAHKHNMTRKARQNRVEVSCRVCGEPATISEEAVKRRERDGNGPYRCRYCQGGRVPKDYAEVVEIIGDKSWLTEDERESVRDWARRVARSMSTSQLREIAAAIDAQALRDVDDSTFARPPRPRSTNHLALLKATPAFLGEIKGRREREAA